MLKRFNKLNWAGIAALGDELMFKARHPLIIPVALSLLIHATLLVLLWFSLIEGRPQYRLPIPTEPLIVELQHVHPTRSESPASMPVEKSQAPPLPASATERTSAKKPSAMPSTHRVPALGPDASPAYTQNVPATSQLNLALPASNTSRFAYGAPLARQLASGALRPPRIPGSDKIIVHDVKFRTYTTHGECSRVMVNGYPLEHCAPVEDDPRQQ